VRSRRAASLAAVIAAGLAAWLSVCAASEAAARWTETRLGAHLWRYQEWMQLLTPPRYQGRTTPWALIVGPSEAREAFWKDDFEEAFNGRRLVNDAMSFSTFEDTVTQLEYIERVYGDEAIAPLLIVTVTPRFLQNYAPGERPLPILLDQYSPHYALDESVEPQALVEKGPVGWLLGHLRALGHSGIRYRRAVYATGLAAKARVTGTNVRVEYQKYGLVPSRFYDQLPLDKQQYYDWARTGKNIQRSFAYFMALRRMDTRAQRPAIIRDFARLRRVAERAHARVLVVNMPEGGWARSGFYDPGIHETYMAVLREAIGDLPFLDLRDALPDDAFFDWMHPTRRGGRVLTRKVAETVRQLGVG
jgi:hypothetical protein